MRGVKTFVEQHGSRWLIKIGYGYAERVSPRNTHRNESVRMLLPFMPIFPFNAWILALFKNVDPSRFHPIRALQITEFVEPV